MSCADDKLPGISDERVPLAIEENLLAWWGSLEGMEGMQVDRADDLLRVLSGVKHPLCNHIFRARFGQKGAEEAIRSALEPAARRGLPLLWWVSPATMPLDLGTRLELEGLELAQDISCRAADLIAVSLNVEEAPAPVERVTDLEGLERWIRPFEEGFELPSFVGTFFAGCMAAGGLADEAPSRHYLVTLDGEPVSVLSAVFSCGVVGFYNGTTVPAVRGRRLARSLVAAAVKDAIDMGYSVGVVQATPTGAAFCAPLGFEEFYRMQAYVYQPG